MAKRRAVVEIKNENWAKMQLLAHSAGLPDREIDRISPSPQLGRWPNGNLQRERGVAACSLLKDRLPVLMKIAGLNPKSETSADDLYRYVFEADLDYWALANQLGADKQTREWLAMEGSVCRYVIWPKQEAQFFYATHLPRAINECDTEGCVAILGSFVLAAKQKQPTRVKFASSYYLLGSGELRKRGTWKSQTCGFDEERLIMVYELDEPEKRRYAGVISLERDQGQTPVIANGSYRGTRCFNGQIFTLGDSDFRSGPFAAEEVGTVKHNLSHEEALLSDKDVQAEFMKRLNMSTSVCRYCANTSGLSVTRCGYFKAAR